MLLFTGIANSDVLQIPYSCWPIQLREAFSEKGIKLDLDPNERTKDSWGYVLNKGSTYDIFTYYSATSEDFKIVQEIIFKVEEENE